MVKYICIHPPKVFIQVWIKLTQMGKSKTRGICELRNRYTKHNMKGKKCRNTYYKDNRKYIQRWWYINRRIRPPTKIQPIIPIIHTPCNIKNKNKYTNIKPCNIICKIDLTKLDYIQQNRNRSKGTKHERAYQKNTEGKLMVTTPTLCRDCKHTINHNSQCY